MATEKADSIIRAAIFRCLHQVALSEKEIECLTDVLIVGSGVAGLTAAYLLAEAGRRVYLVEKRPAVGGTAVLLGDVFPNLECASCMLEPLMDDVLHHPLIEVLPYSEVTEILGYFGNFQVSIKRKARHVSEDGCFGCRTCHDVCPVQVPNQEYDFGLSKRKAIYIPYP
ncbi:FAD-dependent oxidoreductase, partial [candidate division CSSED10-310 bacterium]